MEIMEIYFDPSFFMFAERSESRTELSQQNTRNENRTWLGGLTGCIAYTVGWQVLFFTIQEDKLHKKWFDY